MTRSGALLVVCLLLFGGTAGSVASADAAQVRGGGKHQPASPASTGEPGPQDNESQAREAPNASIVAMYPNPVTTGDVGESVTVDVPAGTRLGNWTITDDSGERVTLPDRTVSGRVTVSHSANRTRNRTALPVLAVTTPLGLANGGEKLHLRQDGRIVDSVSYEDAPEGERWLRSSTGSRWRPLGATARDPVTSTEATATAFVLPDGGSVAVEHLETAETRLLLAGYTLASQDVVQALVNAHDRGVHVTVLVDGSPVGGTSAAQIRALDQLVAAGIDVFVSGGEYARYSFHHAKYAVIDDRALVTTENWKPAGTGGRASRGWGVLLHDRAAAGELAAVFEADTGWRDAIPWTRYRSTVEAVRATPANDSYRSVFAPTRVSVDAAQVLVTPDNAEQELLALLRSATESIRVQQVSIGGLQQPLLAATLAAARRGVRVEIQLSTAWYVAEENRQLARRLRSIAASEGLALTVELVEPRSRFEKVHTKGVVVDDRHVVLGSLNWNNHSLRENREVVLVLSGEEIAAYYDRVLTADRRGGAWRLPVGVAVALLLLGCATVFYVARQVTWRRTQ